MPLYVYICDNCKKEYKIIRSVKDKEVLFCDDCTENNKLERVYTSVFFVSQKSNIGKVTKDFIEQSKEELQQQKKELLNK